MPFIHLNLKQEGKVSACWRYPDRIGDYQEHTLLEIWNGSEIKELRRALLNGEKPNGCRSCWDLEESGAKSTRLQTTEDYAHLIDEEKARSLIDEDFSMPVENIKSIEIRFDNICNLMCRHCSPDYSSKWEVAVKKNQNLMDKMIQYGTYRKKDYHVNLTDEIIEEIGTVISPNLVEILLAGGEPLYHDKHYKFIETLIPNAKNIVLSYNSNLTTLDYKGNNIVDLWRHFKRVMLRVSIDGDKNIYHYVRAHNGLDKIEKNIDKIIRLKNVRVSATCTTSIINITRLPSIVEYYLSLGAYFHTSIVQYPKALNPKLLPMELKKTVTEEWNNWVLNIDENIEKHINKTVNSDLALHKERILKFGDNVIKYMNSDDWHAEWHQFVDYSKALDSYFNTDILEIYPEFKKYF
jgi:MoaA/NifB/PqqE/SkfB family radical SAM enzyme